jgi:hypothetical protein
MPSTIVTGALKLAARNPLPRRHFFGLNMKDESAGLHRFTSEKSQWFLVAAFALEVESLSDLELI